MFTVGIGLARVEQGLVEGASWTHETDEHLSKVAWCVSMGLVWVRGCLVVQVSPAKPTNT